MSRYLILTMGAMASALLVERASYSGVATFNDYAAQSKYVFPIHPFQYHTLPISTSNVYF